MGGGPIGSIFIGKLSSFLLSPDFRSRRVVLCVAKLSYDISYQAGQHQTEGDESLPVIDIVLSVQAFFNAIGNCVGCHFPTAPSF